MTSRTSTEADASRSQTTVPGSSARSPSSFGPAGVPSTRAARASAAGVEPHVVVVHRRHLDRGRTTGLRRELGGVVGHRARGRGVVRRLLGCLLRSTLRLHDLGVGRDPFVDGLDGGPVVDHAEEAETVLDATHADAALLASTDGARRGIGVEPGDEGPELVGELAHGHAPRAHEADALDVRQRVGVDDHPCALDEHRAVAQRDLAVGERVGERRERARQAARRLDRLPGRVPRRTAGHRDLVLEVHLGLVTPVGSAPASATRAPARRA